MTEIVFEGQVFPPEWSGVRLGKLEARGLLLLKNGFSCGEHEMGGSGIPHLRPFNVTEDGSVSLDEVKTISYRTGLEEYALRVGDILYNNTNSEELVGKCAYWSRGDGLYVLSNHMTIMRVHDASEVDPRFLALHLHWLWLRGSARMICRRHVNQASIGLERMRQLVLHRPPICEQRAIAGVLAKIQAAVEMQEKLVAKLKELKAATMAKLFREGLRGEPLKQTEIGEIPESWQVVALGELVQVRGGKRLPKGEPLADGPTPFPYIRVVDLKDNTVDTSDLRYLTAEVREKISRYIIEREDIYISIAGTTGLVGVIPDSLDGANLTENAARLVVKDRERIDRDFLMWFLSGTAGQEQISALTSKTSQPKLALARIESVKVPVPRSQDEQRAIAGVIGKQMESIRKASRKHQTLKELFSSMLHLLMTGRVRVTRKMIALQALEDRRKRRPKWSGKVDEKVLEEVVRRIVEAVAPEKIILFGSAARGEMGPDSDLDILVIKSCQNPREVAQAIRRSLIRIGMPKDVVVVTPEDAEEHKDIPGYIIGPALREGKVLYAA